MTNVTPDNHVIDRQSEMNKIPEYESLSLIGCAGPFIFWKVNGSYTDYFQISLDHMTPCLFLRSFSCDF